jgi:hypothetical protein
MAVRGLIILLWLLVAALALWALTLPGGSVVGGLIYGSRIYRVTRLHIMLAICVFGVLPLALASIKWLLPHGD